MAFESGYYPPGAEHDASAPYNEHHNEEREVMVTISSSLSKNTSVFTSDYDMEEWEDYDTDDEGGYIHYGGTEYNYDNVDFKHEYNEQHLTPAELISEFQAFLMENMPDKKEDARKYHKYKHLINECDGWIEDELEVVIDE